eukprot:gene21613-28613_t
MAAENNFEALAELLAEDLLAEFGEDMVQDARQMMLQRTMRRIDERAAPQLKDFRADEENLDSDIESYSERDEDDTTAQQLSEGRDMQGIPWDRLQFSREHYRETRLRQYRNYTNLLPEDTSLYRDKILETCTPRIVEREGRFYDFAHNSRVAQSNIVHFQLRNLVWSDSKNDVYVTHENCINHYNPSTRKLTECLNLGGSGQSGTRAPPGMERVQVSTLCLKHGILAAGGFGGELVYKRVPSVAHDGEPPGSPDSTMVCGRVTQN